MAISRSLMNRQLRANGGIMDVTPRENFGLGSSLKKFVRKIIPNEVAEIATKAAPFVAPFNPLLAAGMSGIGTFDQTGSIGDSLKAGGMNYALGQGARYIGGGAQNLQTGFNPFSGYDASAGLTRGLLTNPVSDQGGLGKFFSKPNAPISEIQSIGDAEQIAARGRTVNADSIGQFTEGLTGGNSTIADAATQTITGSPNQITITDSIKQIVSPNSTIGDRGNAALDLLKRGSKAAFTKTDAKGNRVIDKAAVLGAATFAASYAEARALAADAGIDLTEEEYDEATKAEKQEEYASYLTNFFGGKKDGGRIGYEQGTNEYITKRERQNPMAGLGLLGGLDPTIDESDQKMIVIMTENGPQIITELEFNEQMGINNGTGPIVIDMMNFGDEKKPRIIDLGKDMKKDGGRIGYKDGTIILAEDELAEIGGEQGLKLKLLAEKFMDDGMSESDAYAKAADSLYANGGRVNRRLGSPEKGEGDGLMEMLSVEVDAGGDDQEDMLMAYTPGFSSQEKSYLFRRMGASGGAERSYTMPQLYRILKNPGDYPEDAAVLKEIAVMGLGKKDGGRIGLKDGTGSSNRVAQLMLERDYLLSKDEDVSFIDLELERDFGIQMKAEGGIMEAKAPTGQMRENNAGVAERDYRQTGGFVPVGIKERADDVPAMLSKNEFVMTADAVRGIGNGSVEEGSKKLYNTMKQAEQVGKA